MSIYGQSYVPTLSLPEVTNEEIPYDFKQSSKRKEKYRLKGYSWIQHRIIRARCTGN